MASTLIPVWTSNLGEPVAEIGWTADSSAVAVGGVDGAAAVFGATGTPLARWNAHRGALFRCAPSPSDPWLATSGGDGTARLWALPTEPAPHGAAPALMGEWAAGVPWVEHLAWMRTGGRLCSAGGKVWAVWRAGETVTLPISQKTITGLAWSPDGSIVAAASSGRIARVRADDGAAVGDLDWSAAFVAVSWSPDGQWIAASTTDSAIQIWRQPFRAGEELAMSGFPAKVKCMAWHPSGKYLATAASSELMVWDCSGKGPAGRAPRQLKPHPGRIASVSYQNAGHLLASGDSAGKAWVWNARKSKEPAAEASTPAGVTSIAWSRDDRRFAVGDDAGGIAVYEAPA
jgi:WD40 repeat protein